MALKKWEQWEIDVLNDLAYSPIRELMAKLPHRKRNTIYWKLGVLGYVRETYKRYSKDEDKYITDNYQVIGNRAIAKVLKRTEKSICKRMIVLGLKRTEDEVSKMRSAHSSCFQKGRKSEKTFPIGTLQLVYDVKCDRSFYNIKTDSGFYRFSRYLYEKFNNCILNPKDIVMHLDGNSMNLLKENLVKVSRTELMRLNIDADDAFIKRIFRIKTTEEIEFIKKQLPELIIAKKKTIELTKKIKDYAGKN